MKADQRVFIDVIAPFRDDTSTSRDTAFEKIRLRILGTTLAAEALGVKGP